MRPFIWRIFTRNHHPGNDTKKHRCICVRVRKMESWGWRGWGNKAGSCVPSPGLLYVVGSGRITLRTSSKRDKRQKRIFQASPRRKQGVPWETALGLAGKGHTQHPLSPAQEGPRIRKTRGKHRASHLTLWGLSELAFPASPSHSLAGQVPPSPASVPCSVQWGIGHTNLRGHHEGLNTLQSWDPAL